MQSAPGQEDLSRPTPELSEAGRSTPPLSTWSPVSTGPGRSVAADPIEAATARPAASDAARIAFLQPRVAECYLLYRHGRHEESERMSRPAKDLAGIVEWNKQFDKVRGFVRAMRTDVGNLTGDGIDKDVCQKLKMYEGEPAQWQMVVAGLKKQGDEAETMLKQTLRAELKAAEAKHRADSNNFRSGRRTQLKALGSGSLANATQRILVGLSRLGSD